MPHYLSQVSYTPEAWARLVANPQDRIEAVRGPIFSRSANTTSSSLRKCPTTLALRPSP